MDIPHTKPSYSSEDFDAMGFHDCHVHGIRWDSPHYALILDLDYIVQWEEHDGNYEFWVAPATLRFDYASEVKISLDWTKLAMVCQIQEFHQRRSEQLPNGTENYLWEVEFAIPTGAIELWANDFELKILEKPICLDTQFIRSVK